MAGDIKLKYGDSAVALTIKLDCLSTVTANARITTAVDNTANQYIDALIGGKLTTNSVGAAATGYFNIYAVGSVNDTAGSPYRTEGGSATDCTIVLTAPTNARLIGVVNAPVTMVTYYFGPFSVAAAFGGVLPRNWSIIVENKTCALSNTNSALHELIYQGIYAQYT